MNTKWLFESEIALKAISTSIAIIEENYVEDLTFKTKETSRDIVTTLDVAIEKHIKEILSTSGHRMIGEETVKNDKLNIAKNEPIWFIDPLDGTTNFISSLPFYAISVGLVADCKFLVGSVVIPALKEIFFTMGNQGSFINGKALKKVPPVDLEKALIAAGFSGKIYDSRKRKQEYDFFGMLNDRSRGCLRLGSSATNICYVAAGRLQAAYGICSKIWDVAGALATALQAGCNVYLQWSQETTQVNYVVGAPGVSDEIAELLNNREDLANVTLIS